MPQTKNAAKQRSLPLLSLVPEGVLSARLHAPHSQRLSLLQVAHALAKNMRLLPHQTILQYLAYPPSNQTRKHPLQFPSGRHLKNPSALDFPPSARLLCPQAKLCTEAFAGRQKSPLLEKPRPGCLPLTGRGKHRPCNHVPHILMQFPRLALPTVPVPTAMERVTDRFHRPENKTYFRLSDFPTSEKKSCDLP